MAIQLNNVYVLMAVAIVILLLVVALSYTIGKDMARKEINDSLSLAVRTGTNIKVAGKPVKLVHTGEYIALAKRAENIQPVWDFATQNGKAV